MITHDLVSFLPNNPNSNITSQILKTGHPGSARSTRCDRQVQVTPPQGIMGSQSRVTVLGTNSHLLLSLCPCEFKCAMMQHAANADVNMSCCATKRISGLSNTSVAGVAVYMEDRWQVCVCVLMRRRCKGERTQSEALGSNRLSFVLAREPPCRSLHHGLYHVKQALFVCKCLPHSDGKLQLHVGSKKQTVIAHVQATAELIL